MTLWMYYETDGDCGYYNIRLFSTKQKAETYRKKHDKGYGGIDEIKVDQND